MKEILEQPFRAIDPVLAIYVAPGKGDAIHRNRPSHGFALHMGGKRIYTFDNGRVCETAEGSLIYLPQGSNYTVETLSAGGCYAINFTMRDPSSLAPFIHQVKSMERFRKAFQGAETAWKAKSLGYCEVCTRALYDIILELKQEKSSDYLPRSRAALLAPALDYIHENYTHENIDTAALAATVGVSEVYFRRIFRNAYGTSPLQYINARKLARAKELLDSGLYSVHEAAGLSGFFDDSYFSRAFKKEFGYCPRDTKK